MLAEYLYLALPTVSLSLMSPLAHCKLLECILRRLSIVQVMLNREDRVVSVQQPNGSLTIDHTDGTRITTHVQGTPMSVLASTPRHASSRTSFRSMGTSGEEEQRDVEKQCGQLAREKVVMVEREGCATVVLYPQRQAVHVFLADGTALSANNGGVYEVRDQQPLGFKAQSCGK